MAPLNDWSLNAVKQEDHKKLIWPSLRKRFSSEQTTQKSKGSHYLKNYAAVPSAGGKYTMHHPMTHCNDFYLHNTNTHFSWALFQFHLSREQLCLETNTTHLQTTSFNWSTMWVTWLIISFKSAFFQNMNPRIVRSQFRLQKRGYFLFSNPRK